MLEGCQDPGVIHQPQRYSSGCGDSKQGARRSQGNRFVHVQIEQISNVRSLGIRGVLGVHPRRFGLDQVWVGFNHRAVTRWELVRPVRHGDRGAGSGYPYGLGADGLPPRSEYGQSGRYVFPSRCSHCGERHLHGPRTTRQML